MEKENNAYVGIAGVCAGVLVPVTALIVIFASSQVWVLGPIALALALMAIFLGYFASKKVNQ